MPGLDRIKSLLDKMGNPQNKLRIIHIAGTNGKGSVANSIADALTKAGFRTGLFTTPYVTDYLEQIKVDGEMITKQVFCDYVERYCDEPASEFEFLTAIMYKYFFDIGAEYAVVECGMGGLEDATNCEDKNIAVITSVSLDHTEYLGGTIEKIAVQKAGIIKKDCVCIISPDNGECISIFENECKQKNARLIEAKDRGHFLSNNLSTAQAVLDYLSVDGTAENPALPARQEFLNGVLLDGGHNKGAAMALAPMLSDNECAVIAMLRDKDADAYLSLVAPHCKMIVATQVDNPRALPADELALLAKKYCDNVSVCSNPHDALSFARENGLTLVCGSFYLAREIRKDLF